MPRPRKSIAPAAPAEATPPAVVAPIQIDNSRLQIGDLLTFQRLASLKDASPETQNAVLVEALPMLDRLVVGGIAHRPLADLPAVMEGVAAAFKQAGNPGN